MDDDIKFQATHAWTFVEWINPGQNLNWPYDIGWLELDTTPWGYPQLNVAYDSSLGHDEEFSVVGYPGDQTWLTKWYQLCTWQFVTTHIMYTRTCDIAGGSSGSPVYRSNTIHCIVSWENSVFNGCARLSQSKVDAICGVVGC